MRISKLVVFIITAVLIALVAEREKALAIPSFSRKYQTSCTTCHIVPPTLNAFGEAFRNRGYRMPGDDQDLIKQEQTPMGSPAWKQVWPEGAWPSDIPGGNFLAVGMATGWNANPSSPVTTEFEGLHGINLFAGGTGGESFSFFGNVALESEGLEGFALEVERFFAQYNHPSHYFNVTAGHYEPHLIPFSAHRGFIHEASYLANRFSTPAGFASMDSQDGIEIWGGLEGPKKRGGLLWNFGVVNGNFLAAVGEEHQEGEEASAGEHQERFDANSEKDIYFVASYKVGGLGVLGGGAPDAVQQTQNWRDNHLTVGGYVYRGVGATGAGMEFNPDAVHFIRAGGFVDWWIRDLTITGGYQFNRDRLTHDEGVERFTASLFTSEARYVLPYPWVVPYVRFEAVNPNFDHKFTRTTLAAAMILRANILLDLQGFLSNAPERFDDKFRVGLRLFF